MSGGTAVALSAGVLATVLLAGCAAPGEEEAVPIVYSDEWFRCDSHFDCVAVYDAFCKYTGVNTRYSIVYQDWARERLRELDEIEPCFRDDSRSVPPRAWCRDNRCKYP